MNHFFISLASRCVLLPFMSLYSQQLFAGKVQLAENVDTSPSYWAGINILPDYYQDTSVQKTSKPATIDVDKELALIEAVKAHIDNDKSFEALRKSKLKLKYPNNHSDSVKVKEYEFNESLPPPAL